MLTKLIKNNKFLIIFIFIHLIFFNINYAEWGDSYRILRASEFIRHFSYPTDEKRQPLYSMILAIRPNGIDQIFWGRFVMLWVSIFTFFVFSKILDLYKLDTKTKNLALILFIFNPVILYWSIRIMADMFFAMIVLITFYYYQKHKNNLSTKKLIIMGLFCALGVLTRFEGYLLTFAIGIGLIYDQYKKSTQLGKLINSCIIFVLTILILLLPWFVYRDPFVSKYFEEPAGRAYDLTTLIIYVSSLLYLFGFTSAGFFWLKKFQEGKNFIKENISISTFVMLELLLALVWTAAIPRLFVPAIPFLIMILSIFITKYFSELNKVSKKDAVLLLLLLLVYPIAQFFLKLQFLVLIKSFFILLIFLQIINILFIYKKKFKPFIISLTISLLIWSSATIILHKDIFKAVAEANIYAVNNLHGRIAYNDVSSISDWYMNERSKNDQVVGFYLNMDSKKNRSYEILADKNVDYILITNEHNPTLEFSADEQPYLSLVKEFSYTIRGEKFFTKLVKFIR